MDPAEARRRMVARLEEAGVVRDARVAATLARVPREAFVPADVADLAFRDEPVPLAEGQTVSAPHMVAIMLEALDLAPGHRVLDVGLGSGYHAACARELVGPAGRVVGVERLPDLAERARAALARAGYADVEVVVGDGSLGLPGRAPFDRVNVAAAAPAPPPSLLAQLSPGGVLLVPVGDRERQTLLRVRREAAGLVREALGPCRFVPLLGAEGFPG